MLEKYSHDTDIPQKTWDMYMYHKYRADYPMIKDGQGTWSIRCTPPGNRAAWIQPYSILQHLLIFVIKGGEEVGEHSNWEQSLRRALPQYVIETQIGVFMFPEEKLPELHDLLRVGKKKGGVGWHIE